MKQTKTKKNNTNNNKGSKYYDGFERWRELD
jgi:hypothetical protein